LASFFFVRDANSTPYCGNTSPALLLFPVVYLSDKKLDT